MTNPDSRSETEQFGNSNSDPVQDDRAKVWEENLDLLRQEIQSERALHALEFLKVELARQQAMLEALYTVLRFNP